MVFNPDVQGKRIVLPRIDLKTDDPSRNGESETPAKPVKKSTIPLRVDDISKNKSQQQQQQQQQKNKGGLEHTFRGERDVFLNKGLTSGALLGRDRKGAEYSYRIENFFHNVGSDIFDTPSTDGTQLKKSPSDSDFFSKAAARCGEEKFNELLRDGVEKLNVNRNDEGQRSKMKEKGEGVSTKISEKPSGIPTYNSNNSSSNSSSSNSNSNNSKNTGVSKTSNSNSKRNSIDTNKDVEATKETAVDRKMKMEAEESDVENAKEVGDEKGYDTNELELKLPENFLTGDMVSKGLEHDFKLKRLWRDMLKWKGISQEKEDTEKRKAVNFEEFHAVLEFLKY